MEHMDDSRSLVTEKSFSEFCRYVCYQLRSSGSQELDKKTLRFAIYWQFCSIFDYQMQMIDDEMKELKIQRHLQNLIDKQTQNSFDATEILEQNIGHYLALHYSPNSSPESEVKSGSFNLFLNELRA